MIGRGFLIFDNSYGQLHNVVWKFFIEANKISLKIYACVDEYMLHIVSPWSHICAKETLKENPDKFKSVLTCISENGKRKGVTFDWNGGVPTADDMDYLDIISRSNSRKTVRNFHIL